MKKIHLDPEALDVISFTTDAELDAQQGTVHGRDFVVGSTLPYVPTGASCFGDCLTREYDTCREHAPTEPQSCDGWCDA